MAGNIVLACPLPMRAAAAVACFIMLALTLFLTVGEYTRRVRVSGQIMPAAGSIKVIAERYGRITERLVADGSHVTPGQPMFELSAERMASGGDVEARLDTLLATKRRELVQTSQLQTEELQRRADALAIRERAISAEIVSRENEARLQDAQVRAAKENLQRYTMLAGQGFVSAAQRSTVANELTAQQARRSSITTGILQVKRELLAVQEEAQAIAGKIKLIASQSNRELAALQQEAVEHDGRSRIRITAPLAGRVTALAYVRGQAVQAGAVLATIIPAGSALEAQLAVPGRARGFIKPGQRVLLRLSAFPYQKFGQVRGNVVLVEDAPVTDAATPDAEPTYRVTVRLERQSLTAYGREQQFTIGMPLEADILQDRRRLIEWVVDPLLSITQDRAG
jgi:membrane fusion protein